MWGLGNGGDRNAEASYVPLNEKKKTLKRELFSGCQWDGSAQIQVAPLLRVCHVPCTTPSPEA